MPIDPNNPYLRLPAHRRAARGAADAARTAWRVAALVPLAFYRQFRGAPLAVRVPLLVLAAATVLGGGYYLVTLRGERVKRSQTIVAWQEFEAKAQAGGDPDELLPILDRVLALNPDDPTAIRRRAALEAWSADPDDPAMVHLLLRLHLRHGRTDAAAREAEKRLAHLPNDYVSHCARASYHLTRGDRAAAGPHLDALRNPEATGANPDPSGLLFALRLLDADGRDPAPIRAFLVRRVLPFLRGERVAQAPPGVQATLVACYAEAFAAGPDAAPTLAEHWAPAARVAALSLEGSKEDKEAKALALLADQGPKLAAGLAMLRAANQVTDAERSALAGELEDRTRAAWRAVLEFQPKAPAAYHGLSLSFLRANQLPEACQTLLDGVRVCGDDPRLYSLMSILLKSQDHAEVAMKGLFAAAERNPQEPAWWLMAAEAAIAAHRRDLALTAVARARELVPGSATVALLEARLWVAGGYPEKAVPLLDQLPPAAVARDPAAARLYARTMVEVGQPRKADELLARAEAASNERDSPAAVTAALRGVFDAPPDADRAAAVADRAASVLARWGADADAAQLRAEALLRKLELGPADWDPAATREAARAFERAVGLNPADLRAVAGLAWVRLRGAGAADQALKDAAPLIAAEGRLPVEAAEVLGAVYLANRKTDAAARVLEQAQRSRQVTAGCLVQLARVYHARGQYPEAQAVLAAAAVLPQTARERADYQTVATLLQRDLR